MPFRKTTWSGSFRVMVNFCKASKNKDNLLFILYKGKRELKKHVEVEAAVKTVLAENIFELKDLIRKDNVEWLIGDDAIPRLKILEKVKKETGVNTLVYVQFLYGVHKIFPFFEVSSLRKKLKNSLLGMYPWFLLKSKFQDLLLKHDVLIANSKSTATLLWLLYGLSVNEVVYPLVCTEVFRPKAKFSEEIVTIYSGSKAGDTSLELLKKIVNVLLDHRKVVNIFGENIDAVVKLINACSKSNLKFFKNVSDDELAKIYSESFFTVAPQTFELFGYVPVESMACGTPVLAFNLLGPSETVLNGKTGWLVFNEKEFINKLERIIKDGYDKKMRDVARYHVAEKFSIKRIANIEIGE